MDMPMCLVGRPLIVVYMAVQLGKLLQLTAAKESDVGGSKPVLTEQGGSSLHNHATSDRDTFGNVGMSESTGAHDR